MSGNDFLWYPLDLAFTCGKKRQVQLLGQLQKCRIESTAITHAAVLSSLGSLEHGWRMAVDFLQDMRRESFALETSEAGRIGGGICLMKETQNSTND